MLADLEIPANNSRSNTLDDIGNIDDFLDKIEAEARMSHNSRANTNFQMDPYGGKAQQSPQVKQNYNPSPQHQQKSPAPAAHKSPAAQPHQGQAAHHQTNRPATTSTAEAIQDLESQGYERHNNKGKWINYTGGKATDFRIRGTTSTRVGLSHTITLRGLDDYGNPAKVENPKEFIGCIITHVQSGTELGCWYRDNGNAEYDLAFCPERPGSVRMEIKLASNPMFDIEIQVEEIGTSLWIARPRLPVRPKELFLIDIETADGSRPEGVAPFQVQTVGSVENLRLINNGDGTYRFQCVPQAHGHVTIQITLHGQPIKNSPVTVQVGDKQPIKIKQESSHVETISDTRPAHQKQQEYDYDPYEGGNDDYGHQQNYHPRESHADVSNEDLNRLLDELGG
jgi:hypothetical protein